MNKHHFGRRIVKFGVGVVVAGTLTSVGIVLRGILLQETSRADVRATPALVPQSAEGLVRGGGADFLKDVPLLLVAHDGRIELRRQPGEDAVALAVEGGSLVRIVAATEFDGEQWFLLELMEGEGQGWIPSERLKIRLVPTRAFSNFQFCLGDLSGPSGPCGTSLARGEDAIWLRWDYRGLAPGDIVQRVLVVNGERYQRPPVRWQGPPSGQQLVNLLDHNPRAEPGRWTMQFIVNGELVNEATVHIR